MYRNDLRWQATSYPAKGQYIGFEFSNNVKIYKIMFSSRVLKNDSYFVYGLYTKGDTDANYVLSCNENTKVIGVPNILNTFSIISNNHNFIKGFKLEIVDSSISAGWISDTEDASIFGMKVYGR